MIRDAHPEGFYGHASTKAAAEQSSRHRIASPALPALLSETNVGRTERIVSGALACALAGAGLSLASRRGAASLVTGVGLTVAGGALACRAITGRCPIYRALGIRSDDATEVSHPLTRWVHVTHSVAIGRPPQALYEQWRDLSALPRFLNHLERVDVLDQTRSHWIARSPRGKRVMWDAELTDDRPGERIAWRSVPGSEVGTEGAVSFQAAPGERGTILTVDLKHHLPGGALGAMISQLLGEAPHQQLREDLRQFKHQMEAGESPTTQGQPRGKCS